MLSTFKRTCNTKMLFPKDPCAAQKQVIQSALHTTTTMQLVFTDTHPCGCSLCGNTLQNKFCIWGISFPCGVIYLKYGTTDCGRKSYMFQSPSHIK